MLERERERERDHLKPRWCVEDTEMKSERDQTRREDVGGIWMGWLGGHR